MVPGLDIGEVFRKAWSANGVTEYGYINSQMIPALEIRRVASAFAGSVSWKCVERDAPSEQLFLLGQDIASFYFRGRMTSDLAALAMGRFDKADIIELGRIAHDAVHGPRHPVIAAIFRRFKE